MRAVVQRVTRASVRVGDELVGEIARGLCVFVGVGKDDHQGDVETLADKVVGLRIFEDEAEKMNLALAAVNGSLLAVSQFTLFGDVSKGRRPSFVDACEPVKAAELFEAFVAACRARGVKVETGRFRASMQVQIENDGPVTILLDTKRT